MWAALEEGLACNLAGGTHHAFPDRGLGYCVLNDVAVAIRDLHASYPERRIFIVDTDAHQGNGSNGIFHERQACLHVFDACRAQLSGGEDTVRSILNCLAICWRRRISRSTRRNSVVCI